MFTTLPRLIGPPSFVDEAQNRVERNRSRLQTSEVLATSEVLKRRAQANLDG